MGALNQRELILVLADLLHMPVVDLRRDNPGARDGWPHPRAGGPGKQWPMPIRLDDDGLQVAVSDQPSVTVRALLTESTSTRSASCSHPSPTSSGPSTAATAPSVGSRPSSRPSRRSRALEGAAAETDETEVVADDAPIVQVVARILTQAKRDRASDVHIEPSQDVVRVRFRIDGASEGSPDAPRPMGVGLVSRIKIMAGMNIVERRRPQDGQLTTPIDGKDTDVRVSTAATIWGEKCVMRILDKNRSVLRLHDLGMPTDTHETFSAAGQGALRHGAVRRPDGQWEDDDAVCHAGRGQPIRRRT